MRTIAIIKRDLKKFFRNPLIIIVSILLPIIYLIVVGNTVQGELKNLPVVLVDMDRGPYATRVIELVHAIEAGPKTIRVFYMNNPDRAIEDVKHGKYAGALIIPEGFSRDLIRSQGAELGLFMDNIDIISANAVRASLLAAVPFLTKEHISVRVDTTRPILKSVELSRKIDYDQSLVPGVVVMAVFMGALSTGVFNLIMDRFLGIHESYLVTPLNKMDIVLGLIVSGLILTTGIAVIVFAASSMLTGIFMFLGLSTYIMIIALIILTSLGLLGLMFILLGRADHPRIVGVFGGFLNVILFFPSGAIYPVASFPGWLQAFAKVNPEAYAVHALRSLMFRGGDIAAIRSDLIFLTLFTTIVLTIAIVTFKRRL
ncbi:MAG: ABC transporter permease [Nitrospirota bacterium]